MRKRILISLLIILMFLIYCQPADAKTTIENRLDCFYLIKVNIAFDFADDISESQIKTKTNQWLNSMDVVWNNDQSTQLNNQCQVKYEFIANVLKPDQTCQDYPDAHCFSVIKDKYNSRGNIADAQIINPNSGYSSWGDWSINISGNTAAHEIGHTMGLYDEYSYQIVDDSKIHVNDNYQSIGSQSIMAQTWGDVAGLAEHTEKIMSLAGINTTEVSAATPQNEFSEFEPKSINLKLHNFYSTPDGQNIYLDKIKPELLKGSLIKGQTDPAVYYVDKQGQLRWVKSEQTAQQLFGRDWSQNIIWFSDAIIYSYDFSQEV